MPDAAAVGPAEHSLPINIGRIADQYTRASHGKPGVHTFGLKDKDGQFLLGNAEVSIDGNDLIIGGKRYKGTPALWDLIVMKTPQKGFATKEEEDQYLDFIDKTNALNTVDSLGRNRLRATHSNKLDFIQDLQIRKGKRLEKKKKGKKGSGFLPSGPNALCERLELLMASKQAGNAGL